MKRDISVMSRGGGVKGGGGGEQRQMKRKRNRLEHLFLPSHRQWRPPPHVHVNSPQGRVVILAI